MRRTFFAALAAAGVAAVALSSAGAVSGPAADSSTGTGRVFLPNPVAELQNQSLTDRKDADYAALQPAYHTVTLADLDGSGFLVGRWANVRSETGDPAYSPTNTFVFNRHDDQFEQVMAYYWITKAQRYIQSLGFGTGRYPGVNKESQDVRIDQWGQDNSYSWDKHDVLRFGKGGVDDAEDAEVILHEYGHAIQDSQQPTGSFGTSTEAGSIGEGFGDYWAGTVSTTFAPTPDPACIADWDSVSYTSDLPHCLRRLDTNLHYPADLNGRVHHDGQIWSRALWDIRTALGNVKADTVILDAQFDFAPDTTMPAAARVTVATAQRIYGTTTANAVRQAFVARGIL